MTNKRIVEFNSQFGKIGIDADAISKVYVQKVSFHGSHYWVVVETAHDKHYSTRYSSHSEAENYVNFIFLQLRSA